MDIPEKIALGIVVIAVLLVIRYFIKRKGENNCSKDCFKPTSKGSSEKK